MVNHSSQEKTSKSHQSHPPLLRDRSEKRANEKP